MSEQDRETHTGMRRAADKMSDAAGAMVGRAQASTMGSDDSAFVTNAARGDMLEIMSARHMLAHSKRAIVLDAAKKMLADHTTMSHQMKSALRSSETPEGLSIPKELDARRQSVVDHLKAAPDDKLDETYLDQQVLAHQETADLLETYISGGSCPQLRSVALGGLPVVKRHLSMMKALRSEI